MIMKLKYKEISRRSTYYDLKVRVAAQEIADEYCYGLDVYISNLQSEIEKIPRVSTGLALDYYKPFPVKDKDDNIISVELWHLDSMGDKKRLMAIIDPI